MVRRVKDTCQGLQVTSFNKSVPCSQQLSMHYSFDYAHRFICQAIFHSQAQYTFLCQRKFDCLGSAVKGFQSGWSLLFMKPTSSQRCPMLLFPFCIIFLKPTPTCTVTIVLVKTRTVSWFGIASESFVLVSTSLSLWIFYCKSNEICLTDVFGFSSGQ